MFLVDLLPEAVPDDVGDLMEGVFPVAFLGVKFRRDHHKEVLCGDGIKIWSEIHRNGNADGTVPRGAVVGSFVDAIRKSCNQIFVDADTVVLADGFQLRNVVL